MIDSVFTSGVHLPNRTWESAIAESVGLTEGVFPGADASIMVWPENDGSPAAAIAIGSRLSTGPVVIYHQHLIDGAYDYGPYLSALPRRWDSCRLQLDVGQSAVKPADQRHRSAYGAGVSSSALSRPRCRATNRRATRVPAELAYRDASSGNRHGGSTIRAVRSTPPGVAVVDVDEPDGPGELISIRSASICASDFGYIQFGSKFLLGHELAGVTEDGSAVAIEAIFGCGECDLCLEGRYNLCATTGTTALGMMADGGMSERFRAPSRSLVELPAGLEAADACLVEPTAVAWHACRLAGRAGAAWRSSAAARSGSWRSRPPRRWARPRCRSKRATRTRSSWANASARRRLGRLRRRDRGRGVRERAAPCTELARPGGAMGVLGVFGPDTAWPHQQCFIKELRTVPALGYCSHAHGRDFVDAARLLASAP